MDFYLQTRRGVRPDVAGYPCVLLLQDNWDDYGYQTTFHATLLLTADQPIDLGAVKIMRRHQQGGGTELPPAFRQLGSEFASFGGKLEYYQTLHGLGRTIYDAYLTGLRDVTYDDVIYSDVEGDEAFQVSLLRFSGAQRNLIDARRIFETHRATVRQRNSGFAFQLRTQLAPEAEPFRVKFSFVKRLSLPNRINILVGYNGTGKTRLLSNLAMVATGYGYESRSDLRSGEAGRFVGAPPPVGSVVVVSYSAFDTFAIPGSNAIERARLEREGDIFGYVYCGLREPVEDTGSAAGSAEGGYRLKTPAESQTGFLEALSKVKALNRHRQYETIISPLLRDASFQRAGFTALSLDWDDDQLGRYFDALSSGHKIVLKMLTELTAHLDDARPTLVLIDEPETHLHPPLLASLLRSVRLCLTAFDGFAIIATHSPVLLQETPSRYVHVLRRFGRYTRVDEPTIETFGESIGVITEEVFSLEETTADWQVTLDRLAERHTPQRIEAAFRRKLGFAARSQVASVRAKRKR